jgi:hypothetical protein
MVIVYLKYKKNGSPKKKLENSGLWKRQKERRIQRLIPSGSLSEGWRRDSFFNPNSDEYEEP